MRVYDENGKWNQEALDVANKLQAYLEECFDTCEQHGLNFREASILIQSETLQLELMKAL